jgi:hypothetical protein
MVYDFLSIQDNDTLAQEPHVEINKHVNNQENVNQKGNIFRSRISNPETQLKGNVQDEINNQ